MCYLILAGKEATLSGYALGGHNDDLHGNTAAVYEIVPGKAHEPGSCAVLPTPWFGIGSVKIEESAGISIPQPPTTSRCLMLETFRGYIAGDTSAINEHQVAVVGGLSLAMDRNEKAKDADPINRRGLAGGARYIALQRSKTARECVEVLGSLLNEYGAVFPSCVGIIDPQEAWYLEIGGGTTWLAVRVPDDSYMVGVNGYRIGAVDLEDSQNVLSSPNLLNSVMEKGLWSPDDGAFHWARAFGGKMAGDAVMEYYNLRRTWATMNRFSPDLKLDPNAKEFPLFLKPGKKLDVSRMIAALRDHYEGSDYDAYPQSGGVGQERPVCVPSCIHSAVVEVRGDMPAEIGAVLWGCIGSPATSPYIPHHLGIREIPAPFTRGGLAYDPESAFWRLRVLTNLVMPDMQKRGLPVKEAWLELEKWAMQTREAVERAALEAYPENQEEACRSLTLFSNSLDSLALEKARSLETRLHTDTADQLFRHFAKPGLEW